jgi:hypothetical protein
LLDVNLDETPTAKKATKESTTPMGLMWNKYVLQRRFLSQSAEPLEILSVMKPRGWAEADSCVGSDRKET